MSLAAILEREPEWNLLPDSVTAGVRRLMSRCLAKDPKTRLHDIADARLEIDDARTGTEQIEPNAASPRRTRRFAGLVFLSIAAADGCSDHRVACGGARESRGGR